MRKVGLVLLALVFTFSAHAAEKSPYSSRIEAGMNTESGNTDQEDYKLKYTLDYEKGNRGYTFDMSAENSLESDVRTKEDYQVDFQSRYNLSERSYGFGKLEFDYDRFSGVDRRFSETIGYGYRVIKQDNLKVTVEGGVGAQQLREVKTNDPLTSEYNNAFLGEAGLKVKWQINPNLSFEENFQTQFTDDLTTIESGTALLTKISERMFFKLGYEVDRLSDVPVGKKKTDTKTSLTLVYDF